MLEYFKYMKAYGQSIYGTKANKARLTKSQLQNTRLILHTDGRLMYKRPDKTLQPIAVVEDWDTCFEATHIQKKADGKGVVHLPLSKVQPNSYCGMSNDLVMKMMALCCTAPVGTAERIILNDAQIDEKIAQLRARSGDDQQMIKKTVASSRADHFSRFEYVADLSDPDLQAVLQDMTKFHPTQDDGLMLAGRLGIFWHFMQSLFKPGDSQVGIGTRAIAILYEDFCKQAKTEPLSEQIKYQALEGRWRVRVGEYEGHKREYRLPAWGLTWKNEDSKQFLERFAMHMDDEFHVFFNR